MLSCTSGAPVLCCTRSQLKLPYVAPVIFCISHLLHQWYVVPVTSCTISLLLLLVQIVLAAPQVCCKGNNCVENQLLPVPIVCCTIHMMEPKLFLHAYFTKKQVPHSFLLNRWLSMPSRIRSALALGIDNQICWQVTNWHVKSQVSVLRVKSHVISLRPGLTNRHDCCGLYVVV